MLAEREREGERGRWRERGEEGGGKGREIVRTWERGRGERVRVAGERERGTEREIGRKGESREGERERGRRMDESES